ncbi:MAG: hypothetical protein J6X58_04170 [Bacteroidales bacterium]|nr:hypothetical protein [Bacteroidales bacterium]
MKLLDLVIALAILGASSLLTGGNKKGKKTAPQQAPRRQARTPRMESAPAQEYQTRNSSGSQNRNDNVQNSGNGYFTYENPEYQENMPQETEVVAEQKPEETNWYPQVMGEDFDLKKAFVYQTVMERVEY